MPSFVRGARALSLCSLKTHTSSTKIFPILKKNEEPFLVFRRAHVSKSLRRNPLLKYQQSDYKKCLGRIFGAATTPGASTRIDSKNPAKDFYSEDLDVRVPGV